MLKQDAECFERPQGGPVGISEAHNPHVLRARSGFSALSMLKLSALITPDGMDFNGKRLPFG
ncbi:hypothetical protein TUM17576_01650 [Enterobacter hormaechei]|nr:hypothetical protein TUM17576_01650 [Enterobacter hormaechei]